MTMAPDGNVIRLFLKEGRACGAIEGLGIEPAFVSLEA